MAGSEVQTHSSTLVFYVNGRKVTDPDVDPQTPLLRYLRLTCLTGTKLGCGEGGCGACTVMLSRYDRTTDTIKHMTVMACMYPVGEVHGAAVTTVEGVGSVDKGLHPVQERVYKAHGTQCGFCSPGVVMSMYCLLRNNPMPSRQLVESQLEGNLCRCTGYRPILDGLNTFTKDCPMGEACCKRGGVKVDQEEGISTALFNPSEFTPYDPSQEAIFPPELQLTEQFDYDSLRLVGPRVTWYRPVTLNQLLELKVRYPDAKVVRGNTGYGIQGEKADGSILISTTRVPELTEMRNTEEGFHIGSAVTISELQRGLEDASKNLPEHKTRLFTAMLDMMSKFGNPQIRNVASVGGNLFTSAPVSDLRPVLLAAGATLTFITPAAEVKTVVMDQDVKYRGLLADPAHVLLAIYIPHTGKHEYFQVSKQALAETNDTAIVNSAIRVVLKEDGDEITDMSLCYGGMSPTTVVAKTAMTKAIGRVWAESLVTDMCQWLREDLPLPPGSQGGITEYRQTLAISLFYRFYLAVANQHSRCVGKPCEISPSHLSGREGLQRDLSSGLVLYEEVAPGQPKEDPVGRSVILPSARTHVTGESVFLDDVPTFSNELHLGRVISRKAHAKILSIDPSEALKMPGVVDFVTYQDVPGNNLWTDGDEEFFASVKVASQGQTIAAILADTHEHAVRAAKAVKVEYEELDVIVTIEDAVKANSYHLERVFVEGDLEAGFTAASDIVEREIGMGGQQHFYLEPQSCVAVPVTEYRQMEVISSTQWNSFVQDAVSAALGVPANQVVCKTKRLGGAFGGKIMRPAALAAVAAVAANKCGRPVRCVLDRQEDMISSGIRHPYHAKYKLGFNKQGRITALDMTFYANGGYASTPADNYLIKGILHSCNTFKVPSVRVRGYVCKTNVLSSCAMRSFATVPFIITSENWINDIASYLDMPPTQVHEQNMYREGDVAQFGQTLTHYNIRRCWEECLRTSDYLKRLRAAEVFNSENRWKKRGLAMTTVNQGVTNLDLPLNQAGALVHIYKDGSVLLTHGGSEMGQGLHNKMIQVASRVLKIPYSQIHISSTSSETVPNNTPSGASITSDVNGMAVMNACRTLMDRLDPFIQEDPKGTWADWVMAAFTAGVSLSTTGFYSTPDLTCDMDSLHGNMFNYFTTGVGCSDVEIDCLTGHHKILRTDIVMDIGCSLNPAIDVGQIQGSFVQGCGLMLSEHLKVSPEGKFLGRGPNTYKIPTVKDIPLEFNVSFLKGAPNPRAVYSSKGIGEAALGLAASVFFAVKDAIMSARRESGLYDNFRLDSPATPDKIRMACTDRFTREFPFADPGTFKPWLVDL